MSEQKKWILALALPAAMVGCASAPPQELVNARSALEQAQASRAKELNPAQLHTAQGALELAEATFEEEGASDSARDRAYVAMRKAQLAEVQAELMHNEQRLQELESTVATNRTQNLEQLRDRYTQQQLALQQAEAARKEAEQRARELSQDLSRIAEVRDEPRGTVVTLSGSVLFASGQAELLPAAEARLSQVANTLTQRAKGTKIIVEGHTDTQGSQEFNLDLSERRAEAVKSFLTSHGVPPDRIEAKGLGFSQPLVPNKTAEGRATNRRVEIVLEPLTTGGATGGGARTNVPQVGPTSTSG